MVIKTYYHKKTITLVTNSLTDILKIDSSLKSKSHNKQTKF